MEAFMKDIAEATTIEEVLKAGETHGMELSENDARAYLESKPSDEALVGEGLSDEELDSVAGGRNNAGGPWFCNFFPGSGSPLMRDCLHCSHYDTSKVFNCTRAPQSR